MDIIFATTNERKLEDLKNIVSENNLDLNILTLNSVGWDRGEIEEIGLTLEENSLIKAQSVLDFCRENNIALPIITDDAGLFVNALDGAPGIYTGRYADGELSKDPSLPKSFVIDKLLFNMQGKVDRSAKYVCVVTVMMPDGTFSQFTSETKGSIATKPTEPIKKPYFYSIFVEKKSGNTFNLLTKTELKNTYRYNALTEALKTLGKNIAEKNSEKENN